MFNIFCLHGTHKRPMNCPCVEQILDPPIRDAPAKELLIFTRLAVACSSKYRERPTMKEVSL